MSERIFAIDTLKGLGATYQIPDMHLQVKLHDSFTISLLENGGSTGYIWSPILDATGSIEFKEKVYIEPANPMPGASGTAHFSFAALKPGTHLVTLELRQPWQSKEIAAKTFTLEVTVVS